MYPKLVSFGSFFIPTYGVLVALGFLLALTVTLRLARRSGLPSEKVMNLAVYCAMAGIIGAKLFMFLFDLPTYLHNPGEIFTLETLQAAGVFHGGLIVALIFGAWYMRREELPLFATMDCFAPGIALGQAIGRLDASRRAAAGGGNAACLGVFGFVRILPLRSRLTRLYIPLSYMS